MSQRWIENLVRMAGEAERLDLRASPTGATGGRDTGWRLWPRSLTGLAAAVLALCAILPMRARTTDKTHVTARAANGVNICHLADETRVERVPVDPVVREDSDPAWLLALVRSWNVDCQCLLWELHRFADGGSLANVRPGESLNLDLNVAQSQALEQVLVLAVAADRSRLAGATAADAVELLNCLNSRDIGPVDAPDTASYASAVQGCLPQGVTVVSRPLTQARD